MQTIVLTWQSPEETFLTFCSLCFVCVFQELNINYEFLQLSCKQIPHCSASGTHARLKWCLQSPLKPVSPNVIHLGPKISFGTCSCAKVVQHFVATLVVATARPVFLLILFTSLVFTSFQSVLLELSKCVCCFHIQIPLNKLEIKVSVCAPCFHLLCIVSFDED